ncbi:MAG: LysR family transcriptional regulator [Planctomycetota bacterium]
MPPPSPIPPESLRQLNFNHLRCFWAVAKEGSVSKACTLLGLTQPTISKQIGDLEDSLGESLFDRTGRRLVPTNLGRTVFAYADDIFSLGQELMDAVRGQATNRPLRLHVGISDLVPKLLTRLVLEPALDMDRSVRLICTEGKTDRLLADLALSGLDMVLTDAPLPPGSRIKAFNHKLGESSLTLFGTTDLADRTRDGFPGSLDGIPMMLPTSNAAIRREIDTWLQTNMLRPKVIAEIEDSALLKSFGEAGRGVFFAPTIVGQSVCSQFGVEVIAEVPQIREPLYAVTVERRTSNDGITAIIERAKEVVGMQMTA